MNPNSGIFVAAILATVFASLLLGSAVGRLTPRSERLPAFLIVALTLPMCALAFYSVRLPLDHLLRSVMDPASEFYGITTVFYAPLTEEPAKLWFLLLPWFRARLKKQTTLAFGLAAGLGFGIGEAWLVAVWLSHRPDVASLPWYQLTGYIAERFLVCINHGAFTALALRSIRGTPVRAVLFAMVLHFVGNSPLYFTKWLGAAERQLILGLWEVLFFLAMLGLLVLSFNLALRRTLLGRAKCPECGLVYERGWMAINMGSRRYEKCPGCRHWHWTGRERETTEDQI